MDPTSLTLIGGPLGLTAYVVVFGLVALICFGSLSRARRITDTATRRGLVGLLFTSGAWATAHVLFILVPSPPLKRVMYHGGLIIGLSAVGPWLYFCSAYTGRTLHQSRTLRRLAVGTFLGIVAVKLTNPLHHLYFRAEPVTRPFPHLAVQNGPLHWGAMGLTYVLAGVGAFMLLELFWQVGHDTTPFVWLIGVMGLPIVLDIIGSVSPSLLDITYEPLGVAAFAVGVLFMYLEDFQTIRLAGDHDDPTIVLDDEDRVRDYNTQAQAMFSDLTIGERIDTVVPELVESLATDVTVTEINRRGGMRYYQVSARPFSTDQAGRGQVITLTDVTEREQYRTELERQNDRLEQFASMISHDLRNPLNVAQGRLELALDTEDTEQLEPAQTALARMEAMIDDMLALARQGQPIGETETVRLATIVEACWAVVETGAATVSVESDVTFQADADRLQQLIENLFRNAIEHGGHSVRIRVGALRDDAGFYVADDGPGIPADEREAVFESGYSTDTEGTGFGLAIVKEIVEAHGWTIRITESWAGGTRFEIRDVSTSTESE